MTGSHTVGSWANILFLTYIFDCRWQWSLLWMLFLVNMDRTGAVKEAHFMDVDSEQTREVVMATFDKSILHGNLRLSLAYIIVPDCQWLMDTDYFGCLAKKYWGSSDGYRTIVGEEHPNNNCQCNNSEACRKFNSPLTGQRRSLSDKPRNWPQRLAMIRTMIRKTLVFSFT